MFRCLGAETGLRVEVAADEVAELPGPDLALAVDAHAARPRDHLAAHVPGRRRGERRGVRGGEAHRPRGQVISPGVRVAGPGPGQYFKEKLKIRLSKIGDFNRIEKK